MLKELGGQQEIIRPKERTALETYFREKISPIFSKTSVEFGRYSARMIIHGIKTLKVISMGDVIEFRNLINACLNSKETQKDIVFKKLLMEELRDIENFLDGVEVGKELYAPQKTT